MTRLFWFISSIFLLLSLPSCPPPIVPDEVVTFEKVLDISGTAASVVQKKDGGYLICGSSSVSKGDVILVETDDKGNELNSQKVFDSGGNDQAWKMEEDYDQGYYLASYNGTKLNVTKIDSFGKVITNFSFPFLPYLINGRGYDFTSTKDGGFIFGWGKNEFGPLLWKKIDKDGNTKHNGSFTYTAGNVIEFQSIIRTSDDGFIIAGLASEIPSSLPKNGNFLLKLYSDGKLNTDASLNPIYTTIKDIVENQHGDILVLHGGNKGDFYTLLTSPLGLVKNQPLSWGGSGNDEPNRIISNKEGGFAGCGIFDSGSGNYDAYLFSVDQNGKFSWGKQFKGTGKGNQHASDIKLCTDGGYIIVGTDYSTSVDGKIYLIKTDKNGNVNQ